MIIMRTAGIKLRHLHLMVGAAQWEAIVEIARRRGLGVSELIRRAIDDFIERDRRESDEQRTR
jgi:predicted DNA-binding ribbon-helix-helix protein